MQEKIYSKGEVIFYEGDKGRTFYRIQEGIAGVYVNYNKDDQNKLTELGAGEFFGEMAVIESFQRSTSVVAESEVKAYEIPSDKLSDFINEQPKMIIEIINHLGKRIRALSQEYSDAKAFLSEIQDSETDKTSERILKKIKRFVGFYNAGKSIMNKPSAEAVRAEELGDNTSIVSETYSKGTVIFKQGETGECMYALKRGKVAVYSDYGMADQNKLTELFPGDFFGEMGMIAKEARSATAIAEEEDTCVEIITADKLEALFKENPVEVDMILRHVSHRLRRLTEDYLAVCKQISENS